MYPLGGRSRSGHYKSAQWFGKTILRDQWQLFETQICIRHTVGRPCVLRLGPESNSSARSPSRSFRGCLHLRSPERLVHDLQEVWYGKRLREVLHRARRAQLLDPLGHGVPADHHDRDLLRDILLPKRA